MKEKKTFTEKLGFGDWNETFCGVSIVICLLLFIDLGNEGLVLQSLLVMGVAGYLFYGVMLNKDKRVIRENKRRMMK